MRGWMSLPVLDGVTGDIVGMITPRQGLKTSHGSILRYEGAGSFIFLDENGVRIHHRQASPWVEEEEARAWGFTVNDYPATAIAV